MIDIIFLQKILRVMTCPLPTQLQMSQGKCKLILHESAPTFTAEARAILQAANLARKAKLKTVISTDNLTVKFQLEHY